MMDFPKGKTYSK